MDFKIYIMVYILVKVFVYISLYNICVCIHLFSITVLYFFEGGRAQVAAKSAFFVSYFDMNNKFITFIITIIIVTILLLSYYCYYYYY